MSFPPASIPTGRLDEYVIFDFLGLSLRTVFDCQGIKILDEVSLDKDGCPACDRFVVAGDEAQSIRGF